MAQIEGWGHIDGKWVGPEDRSWTVRAHWGVVDGRAECIGVSLWKGVKPRDDGRYDELPGGVAPIRTTDLRNVPVAGLIAKLRAAMFTRDRTFRARAAELLPAELFPVSKLPDPLGTARPGRYPDSHWAAVARVYEEEWQERDDPTKAVAEHFDIPYSTASKHVARARDLGLLPRLGQGRAGTSTRKPRRKKAK
jgi:hypothetical protein